MNDRLNELGVRTPGLSPATTARALTLFSAVALAWVILRPDDLGVGRELALGASIVAFVVVVLHPRLRSVLTMGTVFTVSVALLVLGVAARPNGTDLWSYQMDGRMVSHYGVSPYTHTPSDFPNDPFVPRINAVWRGVASEYGPVLVEIAAGVAAATGTSELAARLAWQGLAACAVLLTLVLLARRTRSPAAVALVGCNPVVIVDVVNAGHSDALIGLAVLGSVLLARARRDVLAALALTAAMLIKAPVGVALVALLVWMFVHGGVRRVLAPAMAAAAVAIAMLIAAGGRTALQPMWIARVRTNAWTPWEVFRRGGLDSFRAHFVLVPGPMPTVIPTIAFVVAVAIATITVSSRLRDQEPSMVVALALSAWLLVALYTSPWSVSWVLPVLALRSRTLATRLLVVWFSLHFFAESWAVHTLISMTLGLPSSAAQHVLALLQSAVRTGAVLIAVVLVVQAVSMLRAQGLGFRSHAHGVSGPIPSDQSGG